MKPVATRILVAACCSHLIALAALTCASVETAFAQAPALTQPAPPAASRLAIVLTDAGSDETENARTRASLNEVLRSRGFTTASYEALQTANANAREGDVLTRETGKLHRIRRDAGAELLVRVELEQSQGDLIAVRLRVLDASDSERAASVQSGRADFERALGAALGKLLPAPAVAPPPPQYAPPPPAGQSYGPPRGYGPPAGYGPPGYGPPPGPGQAPSSQGYGQPYGQPPGGQSRPPDELPPEKGVHLHDGFFFRFSLGFAHATGGWEVPDSGSGGEAPSNPVTGSMSGNGAIAELLLGGTPAPGFVLGGGSLGVSVPTLTLERDGSSSTSSMDMSAVLSVPHLFAMVYPNPEAGPHLGAMVGYGVATLSDEDGEDVYADDITGPVVGGGFGFDGWVGQQWSLGFFGRVLYAPISNDEVDVSLLTLAASLSVTYH